VSGVEDYDVTMIFRRISDPFVWHLQDGIIARSCAFRTHKTKDNPCIALDYQYINHIMVPEHNCTEKFFIASEFQADITSYSSQQPRYHS